MEDKILVNDIIKVKSSENVDSYVFYDSWFWGYNLLVDNKYGTPLSKHIRTVNESYRCMWAGPHHFTGEQLYAIEGVKSHKIFLIDSNSISTYSHTCDSYDNTAVALSIISKQYNKLLIDLDEARRENDRLALKVAVPCKDSMPENLMPPLEDGMFGMAKCLKTNKIIAFYVTEDTIIYESGGWESHSIFDKTGKSTWIQILALYSSEVKSFEIAKLLYHDIDNPVLNASNLIWKKKD